MRGERGGVISTLLMLLVLVILVGVVYILRHPLLRGAAQEWIVDEPPIHADAILIFGNDNYPADRADRAAELFHAGWAPRVVASGQSIRPSAAGRSHEDDGGTRSARRRSRALPAVRRRNARGGAGLTGAAAAAWLAACSGGDFQLPHPADTVSLRKDFSGGCGNAFCGCARLGLRSGSLVGVAEGAKIFLEEIAAMAVAMWESRHDNRADGARALLRPPQAPMAPVFRPLAG